MLKFFLVTLLLVSAIADDITRVVDDGEVQLIINGDESALPEDLLNINVNKIQDGIVKTEQFFPDEQKVVELPSVQVPEMVHPVLPAPSLPIPTPETFPSFPSEDVVNVVAIPEVIDTPVVALPQPIVDLTRPAPLPVESLPVAIPEVIQPETRLTFDIPAEAAPVQNADEVVGEVYKDDTVTVVVNAEAGIIEKISSWMSMVINKVMGNSQETVKVV